ESNYAEKIVANRHSPLGQRNKDIPGGKYPKFIKRPFAPERFVNRRRFHSDRTRRLTSPVAVDENIDVAGIAILRRYSEILMSHDKPFCCDFCPCQSSICLLYAFEAVDWEREKILAPTSFCYKACIKRGQKSVQAVLRPMGEVQYVIVSTVPNAEDTNYMTRKLIEEYGKLQFGNINCDPPTSITRHQESHSNHSNTHASLQLLVYPIIELTCAEHKADSRI
ncbi:Protein of unknown function, partial [Gryllus bimaculatus]